MTHDQLVQKAITTIEEVFSDTSVSPEVTIDSLKALKEDIEMRIDAIKCDIG